MYGVRLQPYAYSVLSRKASDPLCPANAKSSPNQESLYVLIRTEYIHPQMWLSLDSAFPYSVLCTALFYLQSAIDENRMVSWEHSVLKSNHWQELLIFVVTVLN